MLPPPPPDPDDRRVIGTLSGQSGDDRKVIARVATPAAAVRALRWTIALSQRELSRRGRVAQEVICRLENAEVGSFAQAVRLAAAVGVELEIVARLTRPLADIRAELARERHDAYRRRLAAIHAERRRRRGL